MFEMFTDQDLMRSDDFKFPADGTIVHKTKICYNSHMVREWPDPHSEERNEMRIQDLKETIDRLIAADFGDSNFKIVVQSDATQTLLHRAEIVIMGDEHIGGITDIAVSFEEEKELDDMRKAEYKSEFVKDVNLELKGITSEDMTDIILTRFCRSYSINKDIVTVAYDNEKGYFQIEV